jgi:hypothetical protein
MDISEERLENLPETHEPAGAASVEDEDRQPDTLDDAPEGTQTGKKSRTFPRILHLNRGKTKVLTILFTMVALAAMGVTMGPEWLKKEKRDISGPIRSTSTSDNLMEESLSPFFIPLSEYENRIMVRIDLTAVWPALASVKYRKQELRIRDQIFKHIVSLARQKKDLTDGSELIEDNLGRILQKSLGIYNLKVRVKEINYF